MSNIKRVNKSDLREYDLVITLSCLIHQEVVFRWLIGPDGHNLNDKAAVESLMISLLGDFSEHIEETVTITDSDISNIECRNDDELVKE